MKVTVVVEQTGEQFEIDYAPIQIPITREMSDGNTLHVTRMADRVIAAVPEAGMWTEAGIDDTTQQVHLIFPDERSYPNP
jgi:hypothetical protein